MARTLSLDKTRSADVARQQARRSALGAQHSDIPKDYWKAAGPSVQFGRERFRVWWVPGSGKKQNIDANVENIAWDDATAVLTGTLQMRDPAIGKVPDLGFGDEIMLECSLTGAANFIELWRMRVQEPSRDFGPSSRTFQMTNALGWLARSTDDFHYSKDKAHPLGWLASEIVLDLAGKYNIPVGVIATTTHRIKKLVKLQASPLDVIAEAYKREKHYTHKRFVVSCDHGKLNILPLVRSPRLLELGPTLIAAAFQQQMQDEFATSLKVRARGLKQAGKDKKGKKRTGTSKLFLIVQSNIAVARFGFIQREVWVDAETVAEARTLGTRHLTLVGKPQNTLTLTHPGIPTIKRGDAVRALLPDQALRQVIFVTEARHTLNPGDYQMELTMGFTDPLVDAALDKATEDRNAAARARGRNGSSSASTPPLPPGADQRQNQGTPGQRLSGRGHQAQL